MINFRVKPRAKPVINITPLIDIVFQLLIFFMLTTQFKYQPAIPIQVPNSSTATEHAITNKHLIELSEKGDVVLDGGIVSWHALETRLNEHKNHDKELRIELRADEAVTFQQIIQVIDTCRNVGVEELISFTKKQ